MAKTEAVVARFTPGDAVRVLPLGKPGHVRTPHYILNKRGEVVEFCGFFLNPEVTALKIASIVPGMPAARAGIQTGDLITKVDGLAVAGSKATALKSHAEREVGQSLRLELKHANGQVYTVNMVAVPKP